MKRYELVGGPHYDIKNVKYEVGTVFETDEDLCVLWPNKFRPVPDAPAVPPVIVRQEPATPVPAPVKVGALATEPLPSLDTLPSMSMETDEDKEVAATKGHMDGANNVTSQFPQAEDTELLVWKKGLRYFVTDAESPTAPLNEKPLKRSEVSQFLSSYRS
jgi:hypothetical protein